MVLRCDWGICVAAAHEDSLTRTICSASRLHWTRAFSTIRTHFDAVYTLANDRRDVYDSFEATFRQSLRKQYGWMASYTRSRALSNGVVDVNIDDPTTVLKNVGPMPWDAPTGSLAGLICPCSGRIMRLRRWWRRAPASRIRFKMPIGLVQAVNA